MPRADLRAVQEKRLAEAVERAYERSPFFRRRFEAAGLRPNEIATLDTLGALPPFRKSDLRRSEAEAPPIGDYRCVGFESAVRLATSTGTTGRPTFTLWTSNDLDLDYELGARYYWRQGYRPRQVVVNSHPGYLNGGQALLAGTMERLGMLPISVGPPETSAHAEQVLRTLEGIPIDQWALLTAALARFREAAVRIGSRVELPLPERAGPSRQYET